MRSRKARRRGGKAVKRGVSREQVPVPAAADRGGATVSAVSPAVSAAALEGALEPVVETDVVLVSDDATGYLRRFHLIGLADPASPRACLSAAMSNQSIRSAN